MTRWFTRNEDYTQKALNILKTIEQLKTTGNQMERECARRFRPPYGLTVANCRNFRVNRRQVQALIDAHSELVVEIMDRQHREVRRRQKSIAKYLSEQSSALRKNGWIVYASLPPRICSKHNEIEITFHGGEQGLERAKALVEKLTQTKADKNRG